MTRIASQLRAAFVVLIAGCAVAVTGCRDGKKEPTMAAGGSRATGLFTDAAAAAGVRFRLDNGARGQFDLLESTGSGCAWFDYDNDGWPDLLLLQAGPLPHERDVTAEPRNRLLRNRGNGTFEDVTRGSGLEDTGYSQGVAIGDVDGDHFDDVFVTAYGGNHLFLNQRGSGSFRDVTEAAGLADTRGGQRWGTSAAFGDYDRDGRLDLYVCRYVQWSPRTDLPCRNPSGTPSYCTPEIYPAERHALYHNEGGGRFTDVSERSRIASRTGRGLGVAWLDYDGDGWEDIFVANDLTPFFLWRNNHDGTFTSQGDAAGVAYSDMGSLLSGMGVGVRDYDGDGREDLFVTNFSGQMNALFRNAGGGLFTNATLPSGVGPASITHLGFGCEFLDYHRDGHPDVIVGNGHVNPDVKSYTGHLEYAMPKSLYRNEGDGRFTLVRQGVGDLAIPRVTRGLAIADFDGDGHQDVAAVNQDAAVELLRYSGEPTGHWISLRTQGSKSNPDGYHARVKIRCGRQTYFSEVRSGSSYLSSSDRSVYFGLGSAQRVDEVEISWYGTGTVTRARDLPADRAYRVREGGGIEPLR